MSQSIQPVSPQEPIKLKADQKDTEALEANNDLRQNRRQFNLKLGAMLGAAGVGLMSTQAKAQEGVKSRIVERIQREVAAGDIPPEEEVQPTYDKGEHGRYLK